MNGWGWWLLVALVLLAWSVWWTALRLDRLHARLDGSRAALDAQLVRRSAVALEIGTSGLLDPASSVLLAEAAHEAREADPVDRELAESNLSRALRAALDEPGQRAELDRALGGSELLADLGAASRRVIMARRFHNDAVRATQGLRRTRRVRYLRLAGRAPRPEPFEMDDEPPESLARAL
ncbi:MAG: hypothetical protein L0Y54_02250 [Sporichthyaceae bacterium]|nr:hypothetical protein [Sporichthyaceae bacterium]